MRSQPREGVADHALDCCPFHLPQTASCAAANRGEGPAAAGGRCGSEDHENCSTYLVKLLRSQRPAFWSLGEGIAFK